jgi:glycosyltransferase involved in cell wall biosynthesis
MARSEFTCLLPVYGGDDPDHFREAARSLRDASLRPDQIIICQDGLLPSALAEAVRDCVLTLGARIVRNRGPGGLHHNLNEGLKAVRTPWIARCDADDINLPHRFEAQLAFLARHPEAGVIGGDLLEFWPDGRERRKSMPLTHESILAWARWRSPVNHNTVFCRTEDLIGCGGYPSLALKEDYGLWLRLIGAGVRFANMGEVLVRARLGHSFYRRRAGLKNLASEWSLYKIRNEIPGLGGGAAAVALIARSAALSMSGPSKLIYEWALRR